MMGTPSAGMSVAGMAAETASLAEATAARTAEALMLIFLSHENAADKGVSSNGKSQRLAETAVVDGEGRPGAIRC